MRAALRGASDSMEATVGVVDVRVEEESEADLRVEVRRFAASTRSAERAPLISYL